MNRAIGVELSVQMKLSQVTAVTHFNEGFSGAVGSKVRVEACLVATKIGK